MSVSVDPPSRQTSNDDSSKKSSSISETDLQELAAKAAELAESFGPKSPAGKSNTSITESSVLQDSFKPTIIKPDLPKKLVENNPAADIIRSKLDRLYRNEPDVEEEIEEVEQIVSSRSKHQQYMYDLTISGLSLAEIQTRWHEYYVALPDTQKHEVWQEFYQSQSSPATGQVKPERTAKKSEPTEETKEDSKAETKVEALPHEDDDKPEEIPSQFFKSHSSANKLSGLKLPSLNLENRSADEIKQAIISRVSGGGSLTAVQHAKSLLFGLGLASVVASLFLFAFFNEAFIAPFISPSSTVSATPIIGNIDTPVGPESSIIIPKINLEVPVVFGLNTVAESSIQNALEDGVVHFAASPEPGQQGNSVIVGHSSNNILNSGKYKFAFVLLKRLENDDVFYVHKNGIRYAYKVFEKKIVAPTDVSVLGASTRTSTITLITCDPPGTSINRLIIVAEQISPDPLGNSATQISIAPTDEESTLPSNAPSLWSRFLGVF